jgi:hypothetical protein
MKKKAENSKTAQTPSLNIAGVRRSYLLSLNCGNKFVHNAGTHYTHGKQCSDCGRFIKKGTLEYFMTSGIFDIWRAIHNRGVKYVRGEVKKDIDNELKILLEKLDDRDKLFELTESEARKFMEETYQILNKYKILDTEATKVLG